MGFCISYKSVIFFIEIAVVVFAKSNLEIDHQLLNEQGMPTFNRDSMEGILSKHFMAESTANDETPTPTEITSTTQTSSDLTPQPPNLIVQSLLWPEKQVKCEPLKRGNFERELIDILSPKIFSLDDPLRYFVNKTMELRYIKAVLWMRQILNNHLRADEFPTCYLLSLLRCWPYLDDVGKYISRIQNLLSMNDADLSFLPSDVSLSPELLKLYSGEIFSDQTPPLRIFYKLMDMPKSDIKKLEVQLQKFIDQTKQVSGISFRNRHYIWYGNAVWTFLKNESAFDDLKRDMAKI